MDAVEQATEEFFGDRVCESKKYRSWPSAAFQLVHLMERVRQVDEENVVSKTDSVDVCSTATDQIHQN